MARLILNYQLMINGFFPISVAKEDRLEYYNALEEYTSKKNLRPFVALVSNLEEKQLDTYQKLIPQ